MKNRSAIRQPGCVPMFGSLGRKLRKFGSLTLFDVSPEPSYKPRSATHVSSLTDLIYIVHIDILACIYTLRRASAFLLQTFPPILFLFALSYAQTQPSKCLPLSAFPRGRFFTIFFFFFSTKQRRAPSIISRFSVITFIAQHIVKKKNCKINNHFRSTFVRRILVVDFTHIHRFLPTNYIFE